MKREELKALGLTDEQINGVIENYGKSVKELQDGLTTAQSASESAKAELKKYQKGGENYIDTAELERLKTFEKDTLTKETNAKKTAALTKLYKSANAADSVAKLLISGQDLEKLELDDKGELKNGTELLKKPITRIYSAEAGTRECRRQIPTRAATREIKRRRQSIKK
mgnify:CR=1 FL=1